MEHNLLHSFHIPVMGTGYSADTPVRVAPFGITSVISIVDDVLLEKMRACYCRTWQLPYEEIPPTDPDARANRITAYLNMVLDIVGMRMAAIRALPFFEENDKQTYFELLPGESPLKAEYRRLLQMSPGPGRDSAGAALTRKMKPGSIDVNIMVKVDSLHCDRDGKPMPEEYSDAKAALRGYAMSRLSDSAIVFSAGLNKGLFTYMTRFRDFYRDETGRASKKIILKVSDFRSAHIQGQFLAKKGLEVHEYRIESGLNCGGHAFATNGYLLPSLMQEFKENREKLGAAFQEMARRYYQEQGWVYPETEQPHRPLITVQGGIGTSGEAERLRKDFDMDLTGWATPFMLVPEATCVDDTTRTLLQKAGEADLYLSGVSPFGIPFNNVRNGGSEQHTQELVESGRPGFACTKRLLVSSTEFSETPLCLASRAYQKKKLAQIDKLDLSETERAERRREITDRTCLCEHLGNSSLIALEAADEKTSPQLVCPGPNIAWFSRNYTLREMVDHIYGRGPSLVPGHRPHMFAKELNMYLDYFEKMVKRSAGTAREVKTFTAFRKNLLQGMDFCLEIAEQQSYPDENLASLKTCVQEGRKRLQAIFDPDAACAPVKKKRTVSSKETAASPGICA